MFCGHASSSFLGLDQGRWTDCTRFELQAGDQLLLFTDGLTEQMNERQEAFEPVLERVAAQPTASASDCVGAIMQAFTGFRGPTAPLADDVVLMCVRFVG